MFRVIWGHYFICVYESIPAIMTLCQAKQVRLGESSIDNCLQIFKELQIEKEENDLIRCGKTRTYGQRWGAVEFIDYHTAINLQQELCNSGMHF